MGGKDPNRQPQLASLRITPVGWVRMAKCMKCGYLGAIPVDRLIKKHGLAMLVELAMVNVRCSACENYGATDTMLKLCEPGCSKQRG
jgi:hypothetical protein